MIEDLNKVVEEINAQLTQQQEDDTLTLESFMALYRVMIYNVVDMLVDLAQEDKIPEFLFLSKQLGEVSNTVGAAGLSFLMKQK